jgi:hypothetical protein
MQYVLIFVLVVVVSVLVNIAMEKYWTRRVANQIGDQDEQLRESVLAGETTLTQAFEEIKHDVAARVVAKHRA